MMFDISSSLLLFNKTLFIGCIIDVCHHPLLISVCFVLYFCRVIVAGDSVVHTEESSAHLTHKEKAAKAQKLGASPSKQVIMLVCCLMYRFLC